MSFPFRLIKELSAERDKLRERVAELEEVLPEAIDVIERLKAELAALKNQAPVAYLVEGMGTVSLQYKNYPEWARNDPALTCTPLVVAGQRTQAQPADAYRMARALSDRYADQCGVDKDDYWKLYGQDCIDDVRAMLEGAKHE